MNGCTRGGNSQPSAKIIKRGSSYKSWEATKQHPAGFVAFITQLRNYSTWFESCHPWNRCQPSEQCPDSVSTLVPGRPDTSRASRLMFQRMRPVIRGHNHRRRLIVSHNDRCYSDTANYPRGLPRVVKLAGPAILSLRLTRQSFGKMVISPEVYPYDLPRFNPRLPKDFVSFRKRASVRKDFFDYD